MCLHGGATGCLTMTGQILFVRRLLILGGGSVMAFSRLLPPSPHVKPDELTSHGWNRQLGMNFGRPRVPEQNSEDTTCASIAGIEKYDCGFWFLAVLLLVCAYTALG